MQCGHPKPHISPTRCCPHIVKSRSGECPSPCVTHGAEAWGGTRSHKVQRLKREWELLPSRESRGLTLLRFIVIAKQTQVFIFPGVNYDFNRLKF